MARPIDAETYMELLKEQYLHNKSMGNSQAARAWQGAIQLLYDMPTLTPPNEPLTLEAVAEILAEQFGDECACNVNGNDEWLPMVCHYGDVCPDPPERLGCWMELLRNKYRRPPERQEDTK